MEMTAASRDVLAERERQQQEENWTTEWDDTQKEGELGDAASCCCLTGPMLDPERGVPFD